MSDLTPGPDHAAEYPDTASGTKYGPQKAVFGSIIAAAIAGVSSAITALADGQFTTIDSLTVVLAVLVSAGGTFGVVYSTTNQVTSGGGNGGPA